jgi:hypothetical protein
MDATDEARPVFRKQEFPFLHEAADRGRIRAVPLDKELLDEECVIDQPRDVFRIVCSGVSKGNLRDSDCGSWAAAETRSGYVTRNSAVNRPTNKTDSLAAAGLSALVQFKYRTACQFVKAKNPARLDRGFRHGRS